MVRKVKTIEDEQAAAEEAAKAPRNEEGLRLDGPTRAEYVAGYTADSYPPEDFAAKPDEPVPEAVVGPPAKPSTHCPECVAPAWAGVPNRIANG